MTLPFRLQRRHVDDDPTTSIGRLPQTDRENVSRNSKVFDRPCESEGIRRHNTHVGCLIDKARFVEALGVYNGRIDICLLYTSDAADE